MYKKLSNNLQRGEGKIRSLSPEAIEAEKRKNAKIATIGSVHKGKIVRAKVKGIVDYGAFIDVDGVNGFIHISEVSYKKTDICNELRVGEAYDFRVIEVGLNKKGILSLKLSRLLNKSITCEEASKYEANTFTNKAFSGLEGLTSLKK